MKQKKMFKTVIFDREPINNLQILMLLSLMLVPVLRWAIFGYGAVIFLIDVKEELTRRKKNE